MKGAIIKRWSVTYKLVTVLFYAYSYLCISSLLCCSARDTITIGNPISDNQEETLVSSGKRFVLGFFTPERSDSKRYIGIWYHGSNPKTIVWVANRDNSLPTRNGVLAIEDGNLKIKVRGATGIPYCFTDLDESNSTIRMVKLMDSGNLVLSEGARILWQSFDYPTDTFLPGMKMVEDLTLTSWKGELDPGSGSFTFKKDQDANFVVWKNEIIKYWVGGDSFSGEFFTSEEMLVAIPYFLTNFTQKSSISILTRSISLPLFKFTNMTVVMNFTGKLQYWSWDGERGRSLVWEKPSDRCSVYNVCGNYGSCNLNRNPICKCLPGYKPRYNEHWDSGGFFDGCYAEATSCEQSYKFLGLKMMKVGKPDLSFPAKTETDCWQKHCNSCNCKAYSYHAVEDNKREGRDNCGIWTAELSNLQEEYTKGHNHNLSIRLPTSAIVKGSGGLEPISNDGSRENKQLLLIVGLTISSVSIFSCAIVFIYIWRRNARRRAIRRNPVVHRFDSERHAKDLIDSGEFKEEDKKGIDVPFFKFESIVAATDNFSDGNKLGQGGYGPVYKGTFPGGKEIAVKRLSSFSGQGLQEFKNEVVLIAKLQHRNLVKLWGYCVKGEEKILLYEYMPNRSLDAFIFDSKLSASLDWEMRFNIILGIARGLLYLHQDSRLRIIHRDMKTSNILLDEEMNPKISDFGLARIVGGKQNEANTNRVVGTYGYMSPEYALDGIFSVKSDVFSFGVVLLEIISGKRNTGFSKSEEALNLLGYAWKLWKEEHVLDLMDEALHETCNRSEFVKCVNVGLLCVQEDPNDRPTMSNVVFMLGSENATLPSPKPAAFVLRSGIFSMASSSSKTESNADNFMFSFEESR